MDFLRAWQLPPSLFSAENIQKCERPYKAFGYPVVPILFLFVAGWLLLTTIQTDFAKGIGLIGERQYWDGFKDILFSPSLMGIFLILLGLPVYYYLVVKIS